MLRKVIGILIALAIVGSGVVYYMMHKPHKTADGEKPVATLSADDLIDQYSGDMEGCNLKYLEKVIQVEGIVASVSTSETNEKKIALQTIATDELGIPSNITFVMSLDQKTDEIKEGTNVVLKGICTGYNTDVEFKQAVLVKK